MTKRRWLTGAGLTHTQEACWRQARDLAPILTALRMGTLSATLARAMLADQGIGVREVKKT